MLTKKAVEVISKTETPLFLYLAYQAPHAPIAKPPKQYLQQYADQVLNLYQQIDKPVNKTHCFKLSWMLSSGSPSRLLRCGQI